MAKSTLLAVLKFQDNFSQGFNKAMKSMDVGSVQAMKRINSLNEVSRKIGQVGTALTTAVTLPIVGLGVKAVKSVVAYEGSIAKIMTLKSKLMQDGLTEDGVRKSAVTTIDELSSKFGRSRKEIASAYYDLASAFNETKDMAQGMDTAMKLAIVGQTESVDAAKALARIYNVYDDVAIDKIGDILMATQNWGYTTIPEMGEYIGKILSTAKQAGVGIEDLFSAIAVLTSNTGDTAESVTYLDNALKKVIERGDRKKMEKIGLIAYFDEIKKEAPEIEDIMKIFTNIRGAKGAVGLTSAIDLFKKYKTEIAGATGSLSATFKDMSKTAQHSFATLHSNFETTMEKIGEKLLPRVNNGIAHLNEYLRNLTDEDINRIVLVGKALAAIGPILIKISVGLKAISGLTAIIEKIKSFFTFIHSLGPKVLAIGSKLSSIAMPILSKVGAFLGTTAGTVTGGVGVGLAAAHITNKKLESGDYRPIDEDTNKYVPDDVEKTNTKPRRAVASQATRANATGTGNFVGGQTYINEHGPELVTLPSGSKILPANQTSKMLGGLTINIPKLADQLVIRAEEDIDLIVNKLSERLMRVYVNS